MIRRVLVGTDFSETSEGALRWGLEIARAHDARGDAGPRAAVAELRHAVRAGAARDRHRARAQGARSARRDRSGAVARRRTEGHHRDPSRRARLRAARRRARGQGRPGGGRNPRPIAARASTAGLGRRASHRRSCRSPCSRSIPRTSIATGRCAGYWSPPTSRRRRCDRPQVALDLIGARGKGELILAHAYHMPVEYSAYGALPTNWNFAEEAASAAKTELDKWAPSCRRRVGR